MFKKLALFILILLSLSGQLWAEPGPGPGAPIGGISNTFTGSFFDFNSSVRLRNHLGSELVTNGTFTGAATGWTLGTGWAYSANTVVKNDDGTGTLSPTTALTITANSIYRVAYAVSSMTVSSVTASMGGVTFPVQSDNDSLAVFYVTASSTANLVFTPTNTSRFTIDNVSVKKVGTAGTDTVVLFEDDRDSVAGGGSLFSLGESGGHSIRIGNTGIGLGDSAQVNHQNAGTANYEYGVLGKINSGAGGLNISGYTDADGTALALNCLVGSEDPTDTTPSCKIVASKKSGSSSQVLGADETVYQLYNSNTVLQTVLGDGRFGIGIVPLKQLTVMDNIDGEVARFQSANGADESTLLGFTYSAATTVNVPVSLGLKIDSDGWAGSAKGALVFNTRSVTTDTAPTERARITSGGSFLINETANTNSTIGLTIQQGANDDTIFALKSSDVGHAFSFVESDTYAYMQKLSATAGGLFLGSMTDGDATAMMLLGMIGTNNPTDTTPAIKLIGGKLDGAGTGLTVLGDAETVLQVLTGDSVTTTALFTILGSGYTGVRDATPAVPFSVSGYAAQDATDTTASFNSGNAAKNTTLQFRQTTTPRWALTSESGGANFNIYQYTAGWLIALDLDSNLNMGLATSLFGTNAAKVFAIGSGTAPTTSPADAVQMWSADLNAEAGKAALHLRTEDGAVHVFGSNVGIGTTGPENKLDIALATGDGIRLGQVDTGAGTTRRYIGLNDLGPAGAFDGGAYLSIDGDNTGNYGLTVQTQEYGVANHQVTFKYNGNVGIGTTTFGTNLAGGLALGNGTAATAALANGWQAWSADFLGTGGDARMHIMGEGSATALTVLGSGKITTQGTTGGYTKQLVEATATLSGASTTIQVNIPSGSRILGVQLRVDTLITSGDGGTTWTAAFVNVPTTAITSGQAFTKNTKFAKITADEISTGEVDITVTPNAGTFSAGVIRAIVYYELYDTMADAA